MRHPLKSAKAIAEFTPNTAHESAGTVTVTMTAEVAAFILGQIGATAPSAVGLPNGQKLDLYIGIYKALHGVPEVGGLSYIRELGRRTVVRRYTGEK